jgi:hypothetical protein
MLSIAVFIVNTLMKLSEIFDQSDIEHIAPTQPKKEYFTTHDNMLSTELLSKYSQAIHLASKGQVIYRGQSIGDKIIETNTNKWHAPRSNANLRNSFVNFILMLLPEWKSIPNRSYSLICTLDKSIATSYRQGSGGMYVVLPSDTARIGHGRSIDFWDDFKRVCDSFNDLQIFSTALMDLLFLVGIDDAPTTLGTTRTVLNRLNNLLVPGSQKLSDLRDMTDSEYNMQFASVWANAIEEHGGFVKLLEWLLDPTANEIRVDHVGSLFSSTHIKSAEVWVSGDVLMIEHDHFQSYFSSRFQQLS